MECYAVGILLDKIPRTDFNKGAEDFLKFVVTHEKEFIVVSKRGDFDFSNIEKFFANDQLFRRK